MNVLVDYHHGGLFGSLYRLFTYRLGWNVYRPIGLDWFDNGFWKVAEPYGNARETIEQYLSTEDKQYDPYHFLNGGSVNIGNIYKIFDPENNLTHNAITFETFKEMDIDLIIASHPLHECWEKLVEFKPKAKFVMQIGNEGQTANTQNILSSNYAYQSLPGQNVCFYHQEFDLTDLGWSEPKNHDIITNMVHIQPNPEIFDQFRQQLPEFIFRSYGMNNPDGIPSTRREMIDIIKWAAFGWHLKPADGYGHLIHQWYACGRPLIVKGTQYLGKTGGLLLTDQETCIDIDRYTVKESVDLIRKFAEPENHLKLCQNAMKRFNDVVNFDLEAEGINRWLNTII